MAISVLAFVTAGLDVVAPALVLFLEMMLSGAPVGMGVALELVSLGVGFLAWAAAGFLIAGGVRMLKGERDPLVTGLVFAACVGAYWVIVVIVSLGAFAWSLLTAPLLYLILPLVAGGLLLSPSARQWRPHRPGRTAGAPGAPGAPGIAVAP